MFLLFFSSICWSQQFELVQKSGLKADRFVGYDTYHHLYYIKNGALFKTGELGDFRFQDFQLGPIASVDLINPLNLVVYYEETNTVVFLDNRLNEKERIAFNDLPRFLNLSMVSNAGNNRLWLFNMDTQKLHLYQYRSQQELSASQPLKGKLLAAGSDFNTCTLLTENHLRQLNIYGSLLMERTLEGFTKLATYENLRVGVRGNELFWITKEDVLPVGISLVEKPIKDLQLTQDFLYIYDSNTLYTFKLTLPK